LVLQASWVMSPYQGRGRDGVQTAAAAMLIDVLVGDSVMLHDGLLQDGQSASMCCLVNSCISFAAVVWSCSNSRQGWLAVHVPTAAGSYKAIHGSACAIDCRLYVGLVVLRYHQRTRRAYCCYCCMHAPVCILPAANTDANVVDSAALRYSRPLL
jgi:hypothetical protein